MRKSILIAAVTILSILNSFAFAQSPQISSGLSWLYSAQTTTGNWPKVATTDYYSTAAAMDAVFALDPSSPSYGLAFQWLSTQIVSPTDYLSRQIIALKRAGQDTSGYVTSLLRYRNSDGGFGGASDCPISYILDTALALQSLSAISYSDTALIGQSLNYLTANQNTDGGWGLSANDTSNTYLTSAVLRTLAEYNSVFINQNSINQASAFLLTHQNTDGGFGSSPSSVYDTSTSLISLIESGQGTTQVILSGINYLASTQAADGSWNDDPYSTALALQALAEARPNLAVSSSGIAFSNPMPQSGATTTISAMIGNTGYDNASNVIVRFYLGDPAVGGTQIGTDQIIPFIAMGSSAQASITASFIGTGGKTIFVVVDPDNLISETSKADNKASARLWVATGPDLAVYSEDLKPSTYVPTPGTAFTLAYTIRNLGESPVGAFVVSLYDGDPNAGGAFIQSANISGMNGSDMRTGTLGVTLTTSGNHALYLVADSGNRITEITKTNNTGIVTVNVGGTLSAADLVVTSADITLTPPRPHASDTVQISANVRNIGADVANNFLVEIFDGAPESGGLLITSQTISLVAGGAQTVSTNWAIPTGIHDVYVILDRSNQISELNKTNNRASMRIMTDMVDITLSATDLVFNPSHPVANDMVSLMITAHNSGIKDTGSFNLALYNGDPNAGGVLLQTYPISDIPGDGSATVTYTFTASPQVYRFYAVADPENKVIEMYKDNNTAIRSLTIKSPGQTLGPDLVPTKIGLTDTTTDPQTLAISGNAHVTFQNIGDDKITTSFNVIIFEDKDGDGKYTAGVDNLLGTSTFVTGPTASIPALWPEGAGMIDVPLNGMVTFLHSPLYAFVDSGDVILEQDETNNILVSCKDCEVAPSNPIQPVLKWKWRGGQSQSVLDNVQSPPVVVAYLHDDNGDGKVDEKDDPYLLFISQYNMWIAGNLMSFGRLHAVNGRTEVELFSYSDLNHYISPQSPIAVADINNDGLPEILIPGGSTNGGGIICLNNKGLLLWDNYAMVQAWDNKGAPYNASVYTNSALAIADIDGDGKPEIISGMVVFNNDGSVKWGFNDAAHFARGIWGIAEAADLDMDGKQEIIAGNTAYNYDGSVKWTNNNIPDGWTAIGNLNNDGYPEIVHVSGGGGHGNIGGTKVYLLDHNGNIKWGPVYTIQFEPGTPYMSGVLPVIADFDGDGEMEIGITGYTKFFIFDKQGNLKQSLPLDSVNTGLPVTATIFDLDGDGKPEVILSTGYYFRIFDGKSGALLYEQKFGGFASWLQNVVIADVAGDGHAEIVVVGGDNSYNAAQAGVNVYGAANNNWVNARRIWNQVGYHVTNINDDESVPQHEAPSWLLNNTYRTQAAIGPNPNPYLTPNLTASYMRIEQAGSSLNLAVRVGNGGAIASSPTVTVTFYDGNPSSGGTVIGTASTTRVLNPGNYQDVVYSWAGGSLGLHHLYAVVDAANAISECRKDDNHVNADFTIQTAYADLKIGPEDITLPAGPYTAGIPVTLTANVKNIGTLSASNIVVRMYYGNPSSGGTQIGNDQVIPSINAASSVPLVFTYDTTGKSGTNVLYLVVDPLNTIVESSKTNNTASVTLTVQPPVLPDLAISASDIQLTPATPQEGDKVTVTATIHNLGTATGNIPVGIYLGNPASGGVLVSQQTIFPILAPSTTTMVQASIDSTGWAGQQQVYVVIDPANTITESRKDNNSASDPFFVQSAGLNASIIVDKPIYNAGDVVTAAVTAIDTTGISRSLSLALFVQDSAGNTIATISTADPVAVGANGSSTLSRTWNTGTTLAGQYMVISALSESSRVVSRKSAGFTIAPDTRVNAITTTDKISYNPNETAALTSTVTSQSKNFIYGNITAQVVVTGGTGTIFTDTRNITTLMPGATFTFKDYVGIGTNPPGAYPVTLTVTDSNNAVIATGTQILTITNIIKPSAALKGRITVDKQRLLSGEAVTVNYNVTNVGNIDLSSVTFSILTDDVVTQTVYDTLTSQTAIPIGGSYANTNVIDTTKYTAKDYLVILQATIGGTTETIGGSYFRIEGAPTAPSLAAPAAGSDVLTFTPTLSVNNASDPNDDKLTYEFELYTDSGLANLLSSSGTVTEGTGITSWTAPLTLTEDQTYYWRSRVYDGWLYGPWTTPMSFRVNTINEPPTAPTIASPADSTSVATFAPTLIVNNATDPDTTNLTYNFDVALDPGFTQIVATTKGIMSGPTNSTGSGPSTGSGGITSWQVPVSLSEDTWYYWHAQADSWFVTGPWSVTARFFVNTINEPSTTPVIITPANGATIAALATDITITNSTDPDSPVITYFFEVDTVTTFDSPSIIRSGSVAQGQGTTTWHVTGLQEDTQYYVRVKASDGLADSPWSSVMSFFANAVNEPPTVPTLANPSNGAGVTASTPTLSVHDSTDPDRDVLTYDLEVYSDAALSSLVTSTTGVAETSQVTSWTVPFTLTEDQIYYWRARAFDGSLTSDWMPASFFMVNAVAEAPTAPTLSSPINGSSVSTLAPTLAVVNATDPDTTNLTYDFEVYSNGTLTATVTGVPQVGSGITSATLGTPLADNTIYQWRSRAYYGQISGPWMNMASFTVHIPITTINATIDFDPDTLDKSSDGTWVVVYIELPTGYNVKDIDVSSISLEGTIPAVTWPYAIGDHNNNGIPDLMVKFKRSDVIAVLPNGDNVVVHLTGKVGTITFEGVDVIRVTSSGN